MVEEAHFIFIDVGLGSIEGFPLYQENLNIFKSLNPNIPVHLWNEEELDNLVMSSYKHLWTIWNSFPMPFYKIDFGRYLILKKYGGIYIDLDMECLKPIDLDKNYVNIFIDNKGNQSFNNNVIRFVNRDIYDKIIEFSINRLFSCKMPTTWKKRRLLYTVGARMYHKFCIDNKIEKTDVHDYFKDYQSKTWLKV